jgi:hypothetical protein
VTVPLLFHGDDAMMLRELGKNPAEGGLDVRSAAVQKHQRRAVPVYLVVHAQGSDLGESAAG